MSREYYAPTAPPPPFRAPASRLMRFLRPRLYGSTNLWLVGATLATIACAVIGGFVWVLPWVLGPFIGAFILHPTFKDSKTLACVGMLFVALFAAMGLMLSLDDRVYAEDVVYVDAVDHTVVLKSVGDRYDRRIELTMYEGSHGNRFWTPGDSTKMYIDRNLDQFAVGLIDDNIWVVDCRMGGNSRRYDLGLGHWRSGKYRRPDQAPEGADLCASLVKPINFQF